MGYVKEGQLINFQTPAATNINSLKAYFKPKQAGTGDSSPSNVREITGWDGLSVTHCGDNLIDWNNPDNFTSQTWIVPECWKNKFLYNSLYIDNTKGTKKARIIKNVINNDNTQSVLVSGASVNSGEEKRIYVTTIMEDIYSTEITYTTEYGATAKEPFIGLTNSDYVPYIGTTTPIDWSSIAGTLYGGYVDLISGEVVKTHTLLHFVKDYFIGVVDMSGVNYAVSATIGNAAARRLFYCDKLNSTVMHISDNAPLNPPYDGLISSDKRLVFALPEEITTLEQVKDLIDDIGGLDVVYELETPITYSLTPQQLSTLRGVNNFWSNANDILSIDYDVAETSRILTLKKQIIAAAPHIITPTPASIQTFNTDMVSPLKECKVHFSPYQAGEGIPSPENVRIINGRKAMGIDNFSYNRKIIPINFTTTVSDGVTLEYLGDGVFSVYGECTKSAIYFDLDIEPFYFENNQYFMVNTDNNYQINQYDIVFSFKDENRNNILNISPANNNTNSIYTYLNFSDSDMEIISESECQKLRMIFKKGKTNMIFSLVLNNSRDRHIINWDNYGYDVIYGGYVDLVKGEVVADHGLFTVDEPNAVWEVASKTNIRITFARKYIFSSRLSRNASACTILPENASVNWNYGYIDNTRATDTYHSLCLCYTGDGDGWAELIGETATVENAKSYLRSVGFAICATLIEPIHYPIDPITLKSLRGTNNIWSNANGNIELSYWKH